MNDVFSIQLTLPQALS